VPGVRLWDDSVELLLGRRDALPLLAPGWDKRVLDLATSPAAFGADESAPLGAVYVLHTPQDAPCPARRLEGPEALLALVSHTYANVLLDAPMRAAEFRALSALVKSVPVWAVRAPAGAAELDRFCAWLAAAPPHGAATPDLG
jgi:hypothetical protein